MKKSILLFVITVLCTFTLNSSVFSINMKSTSLGINSIKNMKPYGNFIIYVQKEKKWNRAGSLGFDKILRERALDISHYLPENAERVKIRIKQKGGGGAHIDSIFLDGRVPEKVSGVPYEKIKKKDNDIADVHGKTVNLVFAGKGSKSKNILSLTARIPHEIVSKEPFKYPFINTYKEINVNSKFYTYKLDSNKKKLDIDGCLDEVTSGEPFFRHYSRPSTGHPNGYTYCWVSNDKENLYAAFDFTPDNTWDNGKDYIKVFIKDGNNIKEFMVTAYQKKWGHTSFVYTDKVKYQHMVYEFKIPLKEIENIESRELELAFSAYGTVATGKDLPVIAFDSVNQRYLVVYSDYDGGYTYKGYFVNKDGDPIGSEFLISDSDSNGKPAIAFDPASERFLVVWYEFTTTYDIFGQMIDARNELKFINKFAISTELTAAQVNPSVVFDDVNRRFLVVWEDSRDTTTNIYGQLVNPDGTLFNANFPICNESSQSQVSPSVAFDSINQRYLVVWQDFRNDANYDIYGQMVNSNGTLFGEVSDVNFLISSLANTQQKAKVAFDYISQRFLVVWTMTVTNVEILGQVVNADMALGASIDISGANGADKDNPALTFDSRNQRFLVTWEDSNFNIFGDYVNADGEQGSDFSIITSADMYTDPVPAYNPNCGNFVLAYQFNVTSNDIGITSIGECANSAPPAPVLASPDNNVVGLDLAVTFAWSISSDPDGDPVSYKLVYSVNQDLSSGTAVQIASPETLADLGLAGFSGLITGIILLGLALALKKRRTLLVVPVCLIVISGTVLTCGNSGGPGKTKVTLNLGSSGDKASRAIPGNVNSMLINITAPDMETISRSVEVSEQADIVEEFEVPNGAGRLFAAYAVDRSQTILFQGSAACDLEGGTASVAIEMAEGMVTHTVPGLSIGKKYYWGVEANDGMASAASETRSFITDTTAAPDIFSARTLDADGNGHIDHYRIEFSKNMQDSSFPGYIANAEGGPATDWSVAGYTNLRLAHGSAAPETDTANDNVLYLKFDESGGYDTGEVPELTASSGSFTDTRGIALPDVTAGTITEQDGASPVIVEARTNDGSIYLPITFSEPVNVVIFDMEYNDNNGANATSFTSLYDSDGSDSLIEVNLDVQLSGADGTDSISATEDCVILDSSGNKVKVKEFVITVDVV